MAGSAPAPRKFPLRGSRTTERVWGSRAGRSSTTGKHAPQKAKSPCAPQRGWDGQQCPVNIPFCLGSARCQTLRHPCNKENALLALLASPLNKYGFTGHCHFRNPQNLRTISQSRHSILTSRGLEVTWGLGTRQVSVVRKAGLSGSQSDHSMKCAVQPEATLSAAIKTREIGVLKVA